jgi:hypothetical protein
MHFTKKLAAVLLTASLVVAAVPGAFATEITSTDDETTTNGTVYESLTNGSCDATTTIKLTASAPTFKVTVPTSISIAVKSDGSVVCPTNYNIVNGSGAAVKVSNVTMSKKTNWTLAQYGNDLSLLQFDSKTLSFQLSATSGQTTDNAKTDGINAALTHSQTLWQTYWTIGKGSTLNVGVAADSSPFTDPITTSTDVASIVFTIGWANPAT